MPAVLEVSRLVKRYPSLVALDDVSLRIDEGDIFALLGPNGAGKTTLIGAVCGQVRKTSGTIRLLGIDLDSDALTPRYHIGLVPQEVNFDPFFTVRECLHIQLGYFGKKVDKTHVAALLDTLGLAPKADALTRELSGGMKRRLLIAKALVHRPRLVFLDEPTAGVDVELRRDLWQYVRTLRAQGTTVVLTTHYLEEAEALADRVGIINHGRIALVEDKQALLRRLGEKHLHVHFKASMHGRLPAAVTGGTLSADGLRYAFVEQPGTDSATEVLSLLFDAKLPVANVAITPAKLEDVLLRVLKGNAS